MGKEEFKLFARNHPNLASYVANGSMTWQKFYEMYDVYGENSVIWDPYQMPLKTSSNVSTSNVTQPKKESSWKDIVQMMKGMDMDTVQKGINGMQKAIGLVQELTTKNGSVASTTYEPRPLYRYFED